MKVEVCEVLFLFEVFVCIGVMDVLYVEFLDGFIVCVCCVLVKEYGFWMSLGGYVERDGDGRKRFNLYVMIDF